MKILKKTKFFLIKNPFKIIEFEELTKNITFLKTDIALDLGCGLGIQTFLIGKQVESIIGLDLNQKSIDIAIKESIVLNQENCKFACESLENIKFSTYNFDKIISICVIEHIKNYQEILYEIYRILKLNGLFIFSVDSLETINDDKLIAKHKREYYVENYFSAIELRNILEEIGFKDIEIHPIFKSSLAKKSFIEGINNKFNFGIIKGLILYFLLKIIEPYYANDKGIFLIIKCRKF